MLLKAGYSLMDSEEVEEVSEQELVSDGFDSLPCHFVAESS